MILNKTIIGGGSEKIKFSINDSTTVTDLAGNILSEGFIVGNLNHFEYVAESK